MAYNDIPRNTIAMPSIPEHEHAFIIRTEALDTVSNSIITLRFCSHCGLTHFLHASANLQAFSWRKVEEEA